MAEFDTLFELAQVAVAMAGFAAIVIAFKRRGQGLWKRSDADRFNGMLLHTMAAAFFCLLPALLSAFVASQATIWRIGSTVMAIQILVHTWTIFSLETSERLVRAALVLPLVVVALLVMNVFGIRYVAEFGPYLIGVIWHLLQAGLLFVMLVWVAEHDVVEGDD